MSTAITDDPRRRPPFELRHRFVLAREVAELDQSDIATALGISRTTVSNYERGFTLPKRAIVSAWALATGVDVDWLMTGREAPPSDDDGGAGMHVTDRYPKSIRARAVATRLTRVA